MYLVTKYIIKNNLKHKIYYFFYCKQFLNCYGNNPLDQIAQIEQFSKESTSFRLALSNVTNEIVDSSGLVEQNSKDQNPFILKQVIQQPSASVENIVTQGLNTEMVTHSYVSDSTMSMQHVQNIYDTQIQHPPLVSLILFSQVSAYLNIHQMRLIIW